MSRCGIMICKALFELVTPPPWGTGSLLNLTRWHCRGYSRKFIYIRFWIQNCLFLEYLTTKAREPRYTAPTAGGGDGFISSVKVPKWAQRSQPEFEHGSLIMLPNNHYAPIQVKTVNIESLNSPCIQECSYFMKANSQVRLSRFCKNLLWIISQCLYLWYLFIYL